MLETLVAHESPSFDKAAVDRCGAALTSALSALGARVTRIDGGLRGDHVRADVEHEVARLRELTVKALHAPLPPRNRVIDEERSDKAEDAVEPAHAPNRSRDRPL